MPSELQTSPVRYGEVDSTRIVATADCVYSRRPRLHWTRSHGGASGRATRLHGGRCVGGGASAYGATATVKRATASTAASHPQERLTPFQELLARLESGRLVRREHRC